MKDTKKLVVTALFAALTCIATMIIKIPTPTLGYIHLGDAFVLLSGIILGPLTGAIAAGTGSMFADIFSGYLSWAPATFIIKFLTALLSGFLFRKFQKLSRRSSSPYAGIVLSGIPSEAVMVLGYFLYEIFLATSASGSFQASALTGAIVASATGIPFNILQGVTGIVICVVLLPVLLKIDAVKQWTFGDYRLS